MNSLSFDISEVRLYMEKKILNKIKEFTLYNCFEYNEYCKKINNFYCNKCHQNTRALSYNKLNTCPEILTIILDPENLIKISKLIFI